MDKIGKVVGKANGSKSPRTVACGFMMGGADAIPGVSGSTIALILGIYEQFISALATIIRSPRLARNPQGRAEIISALSFLIPLGVGIVISYVLITKLLVGGTADKDALMKAKDTAPFCYAFFFGLVLLSLREPWRRIRKKSLYGGLAVAIGFAASFTFSGLPYATAEPATWMLLFGGAAAISVMLLPGVSGSLLLVMLGQYNAVVEALHSGDFFRFGVFLGGILLGALLFVPLLKELLARAHDLTMAMLSGLMAGSLRALWPWKSSYDPKEEAMLNILPDSDWWWSLLAFAGGAAVVILLRQFERKLRNDSTIKQAG
tara:strand:- start:1915 stop:2868 length:954 start_codon:yes stop_codon:yes gene_type:complete